MPYSLLAIAILCLPFVASIGTHFTAGNRRGATTVIMTGTAALCLLFTGLLFVPIGEGEVVRQAWSWAPMLGLDFVVRVDGLAWLFMMVVAGIGVLVGIYAHYYMPPEYPLVRFFSLLLAFMGAMLGIVMSGNLVQLVFFWELTSLFSFLLIGYWHNGRSARDAARTALIVTGGGGLCLLAAVLLLGHVVGSYDLDVVLAHADQVRASPLYGSILVLALVGALSKSAQFPFHFWLPQAMSAPTPASAYLHSATLVKGGVFLLLRLWPVLAGTEPWFWLLGGAGLISLLLGAWLATLQHDLKAILAYSTISHVGLIMMLLGLGGTLGAVAAIFHVLNHATFKASLFMAAGAVDHETGTRDLRKLGGLRHVMPITTTLALIATAAMAGVPMLNGFLSKEMFFAVALGTHHSPLVDAVTLLVALVAAALGVTYSLRLVAGVFWGKLPAEFPRVPHEPPRWMRFSIGFLALACLAVGMFPARVVGPMLELASVAALQAPGPEYSLTVWHGLSKPLVMSIIAFVAGWAAYLLFRRRLARREARWSGLRGLFEAGLAFLVDTLPAWQRRIFPERHLQRQMLLLVLVAVGAATASLGGLPGVGDGPATGLDPVFALLWLLGCGCALGAAMQAKFHRMAALTLNAGAGLVVCITFVWLSAPDLAATQLLVETVTGILMLLGLRWLPKRVEGAERPNRRARWRRRRDLFVALASGAGLATLAYAVMRHPVADSVSRFYLEQAVPGGGGHNVVNVILVDFRGFDTLGEITVLAIVALTVHALLRRFRPATESIGIPRQQRYMLEAQQPPVTDERAWSVPDHLALPAFLITLMVPVLVLFAAHLFLRGHDLPGGGFVAGITLAVALVSLYMARGARWVEAKLRVAPVRWIGLGLLSCVATGAAAMLFGQPFLTSWSGDVTVPLLGALHLTTALAFDLGVFAAVVGASSLILVVLAHQALRRPMMQQADGEGTS